MERPKVCVLVTDGINCHRETHHAYEIAGGDARIVHINEVKNKDVTLRDFQILAIPGGFSYGDTLGAGKVFAIELMNSLADDINNFVHGKGGLVLGTCNGCQVLVKTGLVPFGRMGDIQATLSHNNSGHFDCRMIHMRVEDEHACVFLQGMQGSISLHAAHGEGKFTVGENTEVLKRIKREKLIVYRYCDLVGNPTDNYPFNPNGSDYSIAAVCDPSGKILAMMLHSERGIYPTQHPNWRRPEFKEVEPQGLQIIQSMVSYAAQM